MKLFILILLSLTLTTATFAQDAISDFLKQKAGGKAFANIDAYLAQNKMEFDKNEEVIKLFNQERIRLGVNFETELWKYLGKDLRKHYYISGFVEYEEFLNGNKPLPELARKIRLNTQDLSVSADDYELLGMKFTILRDVVVDLYENNNLALAKIVKQKAERIYKDISEIGVVGATEDYILCVYDNLENNPGQCKKENASNNNSSNQTENASTTNSGGVLNGKAIFLPAPEYPKAAKAVGATGAVNVQVVLDETGSIISANAVSGHALLRQAAEEAAKKAKFEPTIVDGQARKVTGIIIYNFSK